MGVATIFLAFLLLVNWALPSNSSLIRATSNSSSLHNPGDPIESSPLRMVFNQMRWGIVGPKTRTTLEWSEPKTKCRKKKQSKKAKEYCERRCHKLKTDCSSDCPRNVVWCQHPCRVNGKSCFDNCMQIIKERRACAKKGKCMIRVKYSRGKTKGKETRKLGFWVHPKCAPRGLGADEFFRYNKVIMMFECLSSRLYSEVVETFFPCFPSPCT